MKNISENQTFQRIANFVMVDFFEMDFMKGIVIFVKVDEMYNFLKSAVYWSIDGEGIRLSKFFLESALVRVLS